MVCWGEQKINDMLFTYIHKRDDDNTNFTTLYHPFDLPQSNLTSISISNAIKLPNQLEGIVSIYIFNVFPPFLYNIPRINFFFSSGFNEKRTNEWVYFVLF